MKTGCWKNRRGMIRSPWLAIAALMLAGCGRMAPTGSLVLTQTPLEPMPVPNETDMDLRYPPGSRVVMVAPPFRADAVRELSAGLFAAGDPCLSWDGRWVYFAGKSSEQTAWQIYRVSSGGGAPEQLTRMPGGAMDPAIAAHGELVFSSPVPAAGKLWTTREPTALYAQLPGEAPRRLTFSPESAVGATVLRDGRILFVTARPHEPGRGRRHLCLFTINNDGTEVAAYAGQDDGADFVGRPRELGDGRVAFLVLPGGRPGPMDRAECVRSAAPFATRGRLFTFETDACRSVEPTPQNDVLACVATRGMFGRMVTENVAVYRVASAAGSLGTPLFNDPLRNSIEACVVAARAEPAGHTSAVMPAATRGTVLCLDVNNSTEASIDRNQAPAAELRVFALDDSGRERTLGKVPVAADGSVLVYLPVRIPLGFDTLDASGRLLRHQPAFVWLHPGENRACSGCHEARNHSPRNVRPLAVLHDPAHLDEPDATRAPRASAR